jgi:hypothetical protein
LGSQALSAIGCCDLSTPRCADSNETSPASGECGGKTLWHIERDEEPELVCMVSLAFTLTDE